MNKEEFKKRFDDAISKSWNTEIPAATVELKTGERIVATNYSISDHGAIVFIDLKYEGLGAENYECHILLRDVADIY
jgi:hypothetical protein